MSEETFGGSRWRRNHALVLKHLLKKHEGEMVELDGQWERGQGEVPDALFDPQFACNDEDFMFCKGLGKGRSHERSKHAADYRAWVNRKPGFGKGKDKGKEQPAVGDTGQPAVGGGGGKGNPAVGGKGQFVLKRGLPFVSNILRWEKDGIWHSRTGKCLSLAQLFAKCGRHITAAKLYEYYNLCTPIASKRPHPWSAPASQVSAIDRKETTGRYGHG